MTTPNPPVHRRAAWIPYAGLLVLFWGVWGAFSSLPTSLYQYPDPMVYVIWLGVVLVLYPPCAWFAAVKRRRRDGWLSYF